MIRSSLVSSLALLGLIVAARSGAGQTASGTSDVATAIHADRWSDAAALVAASTSDPVAAKLVLYFRLLAPGAARAAEISAFMVGNPDWPNQALLARRRDEALAADPDSVAAVSECDRTRPALAPALLRCADALAQSGQAAQAAADAQLAWLTGVNDSASETSFMHRWSAAISAADQWQRFERLAWSDTAAASRQAARVDSTLRGAAEARLALRRDDPSALALVAALPPARRDDPGLILEQARYLRRAGRDDQALDLWRARGEAAQRAAPADRLADFWAERNLLARRRLRAGDAAGAYGLAAAHGQTLADTASEAEFLAGFVALRRLNDPVRAAMHFATIEGLSKAAITQSRAYYWLGRALAAAGKPAAGAFATAARWPMTFYGQFAALEIGTPESLRANILAARDPSWTDDQALDFLDRELTRAAMILVAWGEPRRANVFLQNAAEVTPDQVSRTLAAHFAVNLGRPDAAVGLARSAGRLGLALPEAGWPLAVNPPSGSVDAGVLLGLMRQESNFDIAAFSPSGARGLMQLMPATAQAVARQSNETVAIDALTTDPQLNMRLGSRYLTEVLNQFGGALPLALAAYNAGPHRVMDWLSANGDPRGGTLADMIDWIELIPFNETRNYVQRVLENVTIYRARTGYQARTGSAPPAQLAQWPP